MIEKGIHLLEGAAHHATKTRRSTEPRPLQESYCIATGTTHSIAHLSRCANQMVTTKVAEAIATVPCTRYDARLHCVSKLSFIRKKFDSVLLKLSRHTLRMRSK